MKITNIYKKTAALFFLMAAALWPAVDAWGQAYVTGDRYDRYVTYIPVEKDYYNDNVTASIDGDRSPKDIFDGDNNTWWAANNVKLDVTFTFAFSESKEFDVIEILAGEQLYERPTSIIFKSGDFEQTFNNLESLGRNLSLSLSEKITTKSFTLEFIPQSGDNAKIALNEVTLLRGENRVVDQTIYHKPAKWYDLRGNNTNASTGDTFQDNTGEVGHNGMFHGTLFDEYIQAAHTYIDTIYVHKGTSIQLVLPTIQDLVGDNELTSTASYQRWYSYRTDKTFEVVNKDSKNNPEGVVDLLTPSRESSLGYRFANGYVGNPVQQANGSAGKPMYHSQSLVAMDFYYPTNTQFDNWIGNHPDHQINNDWYIVACDVSNYTDYTPNYTVDSKKSTFYPSSNTDGKVYEPTLSHRVLFYIVGVDDRETNTTNWTQGHNRLTELEYHGGTKDGKYLEEYDINFPFRRYKANKEGGWATGEILSLSKDARSYAIPGLGENVVDDAALEVSIVSGEGENTAEITLVTSSLTGTERVIQFEYPNAERDNTLTVKNPGAGVNPEATILVTKTVNGTTYNIAKYNLTFVKGYQLLTQDQVDQLDKNTIAEANKEAYWARYTYRTPKSLAENYTLNTELTWDYTDDVSGVYGQEDYYPFPMNWAYSSYAFYDGSRYAGSGGDDSGDHFAQRNFPQWGYYAITKDYIEQHWTSSLPTPPDIGKDESTFHMYVDASDRPGIIARLPFRQNLCPNSELFVSAWVKNASASKTNHDPGMLFTIMGVKEVTDNTRTYETYTPIYRYSTGQIPYSANINGSIPGCGDGTNDWFQIYFSFINTQTGDEEFKSYLLQVENNSASTTGGDMYIDDIQVFMHTPSATVEQKQAVCGNDRALVRLQLGWEQLRSRLAADIQPGVETGAIDFCIIDTLTYRDKIPYETTSVTTLEEIKAAIKASTVYIGNNKGEGQEGHYNKKYATLSYNWEYTENTEYKDDNVDGNLAANNNNSFYRRTDPDRGNEQCLAVDIYAALEGSRGYWLLMVDHNDSNALSDDNYAGVFGNPDDRCAMKDVFKVTAQNLIKINGTVVGDTEKETYCAGQVFNFNIAMTYPDPDNNGKETEYDGKVYFDWYFGTKSDFEAQQSDFNNVSIEEALSAFRATYPDATKLTEETEVDGTYFTENHRNLLVSLLTLTDDNHLNAPLVLHQEAREIRIMEGGLNLVVVPINTLEEEDDFYTLLCWNPIFFTLNAEGQAPELSVGFNDVTYPDTWEGAIRVGLDQIQNAVVNGTTTINIPLRNAKLTDGSTSSKLVAIDDRKDLYLIDSNDPEVEKIILQDDFDPFAYSIGTLVDLSAGQRNGNEYNENDIMKVRFNLAGDGESFTFNPREGYWYKFEVYFKEDVQSSTACYGNLFVTMHVVPAFQKWVGESTGNWNNDANWVRSTKDELKKGDNDSYANYAEEHQGYVPMDFTKVTIPTNKQVELYASANNTGSAGHSILDLSTPSPSGETTENIEYDLMVKSTLDDNVYNCIPYYTNTVNEIHFEPGAEMMHAELLTYKKAWVDYQLAGGRWYALSSPLKGVVSGDFYTDPSGTEKQEYFTDITFDGKSNGNVSSAGNVNEDNSRTNPSVYQRGWKDANATMVGVGTNGTEERAIAGNWSAVYNKADEGYDAGTGFSLKVLDLPAGTNNATFRLPKADTKYTYSGGTTATEGTINRDDAHKLHVTDLNTENTSPITVTLEANGNNPYYLVGNPFMAHLDMDAFFAKNSNLSGTYWVVNGDNQEVGVGGDNGLITTGNRKIAPLSSFFVTKEDNSTANNQVVFTADMQVLGEVSSTSTNTNALTITATTTDGRTSRAAVAYDMAASADYEASEDAELFLDSNLGDVPMVYTVAGTMATSINRTSELYNIPLGVYGNKQEMVTLSFGGLNQFSSATLYDAQEQTETPLREGKTVSVPAGTSGRYFLRAGTPTGTEVIARNAFLVYSVGGGKVMVTSSNTPLKDIRVYTMGGAQVRSIQASGMQQEIYLNRGIYLITVSDQDGLQETKKVLVR